MTKDAIGNDLHVGACVVYIQKRRGGDTLGKGVIVKINKSRHGIQPLKTAVVNRQWIHMYNNSADFVEKDDGTFERPVDTYNVEGHRLVVTQGEDWPEYKEFIKNGWIHPLDRFVLS